MKNPEKFNTYNKDCAEKKAAKILSFWYSHILLSVFQDEQ
jgi:hypothetical protein